MRKIEYLSPTSIMLFESDRMEFYLSYLAEVRPPRLPQTQPMSVGSAFDAYAKSYFYNALFGKRDPRFEFDAIFTEQVEEHNRDWARVHGRNVWEQYKQCGAAADLMLELNSALEEPKFEFKIEFRVPHTTDVQGVPLLGKPDLFYITKSGTHVIRDFKVNGYCTKTQTSPKPGYLLVRDAHGSRSHGQMHKECQPMHVDGILVNAGMFLESKEPNWATQLAIYGWVLREPVGSKFVCCIDQIVGCGYKDTATSVRVALHREFVSTDFQIKLCRRVNEIWRLIENNHIFEDLSFEDNLKRCEMLDHYHEAFTGNTPNDQWFTSMIRKHNA